MFRPKIVIGAIIGLLLAFALTDAVFGVNVPLPARMIAISEKFGLSPVCLLSDHSGKIVNWMFSMKSDELRFGVYPVAVPPNATDAQVSICIDTARVVVAWYEMRLKKEQTQASNPNENTGTNRR